MSLPTQSISFPPLRKILDFPLTDVFFREKFNEHSMKKEIRTEAP